MEILSHDPSTGLMLFKGESAEIAYNKQMKEQFMKLMANWVGNAVRKSAASCIRMGLMTIPEVVSVVMYWRTIMEADAAVRRTAPFRPYP